MKTEPLETGNKSFHRLIRTPRIVDMGKRRSRDGHRIIKERVTGFICLMQWWDCPSMSLQKSRSCMQLAANIEEQQEIASRGLGNFYIYTIACVCIMHLYSLWLSAQERSQSCCGLEDLAKYMEKREWGNAAWGWPDGPACLWLWQASFCFLFVSQSLQPLAGSMWEGESGKCHRLPKTRDTVWS